MKKIVFLFVAIVSMHAAEQPEYLTLEDDVELHAQIIRDLNQTLDKTRSELSTMKIWMIINKNDKVEMYCGKVNSKPVYTITDIHNPDYDTLTQVIKQCFENNKFTDKKRAIALHLINRYIITRQSIEKAENTLADLKRYKKSLWHPNT